MAFGLKRVHSPEPSPRRSSAPALRGDSSEREVSLALTGSPERDISPATDRDSSAETCGSAERETSIERDSETSTERESSTERETSTERDASTERETSTERATSTEREASTEAEDGGYDSDANSTVPLAPLVEYGDIRISLGFKPEVRRIFHNGVAIDFDAEDPLIEKLYFIVADFRASRGFVLPHFFPFEDRDVNLLECTESYPPREYWDQAV